MIEIKNKRCVSIFMIVIIAVVVIAIVLVLYALLSAEQPVFDFIKNLPIFGGGEEEVIEVVWNLGEVVGKGVFPLDWELPYRWEEEAPFFQGLFIFSSDSYNVHVNKNTRKITRIEKSGVDFYSIKVKLVDFETREQKFINDINLLLETRKQWYVLESNLKHAKNLLETYVWVYGSLPEETKFNYLKDWENNRCDLANYLENKDNAKLLCENGRCKWEDGKCIKLNLLSDFKIENNVIKYKEKSTRFYISNGVTEIMELNCDPSKNDGKDFVTANIAEDGTINLVEDLSAQISDQEFLSKKLLIRPGVKVEISYSDRYESVGEVIDGSNKILLSSRITCFKVPQITGFEIFGGSKIYNFGARTGFNLFERTLGGDLLVGKVKKSESWGYTETYSIVFESESHEEIIQKLKDNYLVGEKILESEK